MIAFKALDGASFWVKNATKKKKRKEKKKHLLAYKRFDKNALKVVYVY